MKAQAPIEKLYRAPYETVARPVSLMPTPKQVAEMLGVHRATLYRWLERGVFPPPTLKVGRTVRWSRELVEQFAREGVRHD